MELLNQIIQSLNIAFPLMLITMGVILIFKTSFTTNFTLGVGSTFAACVSGIVFLKLGKSAGLPNYVWVPVALLAGATFGFLLGSFIDAVIFRSAKRTTVLSMQMVTMGLVLIIAIVGPLIFETKVIGQEITLKRMSEITFKLGTIKISMQLILTIAISSIILLVLFLMLRYTKWGVSVRTTAVNKQVAELMGINTNVITTLSWGIAGAIGAVGGFLLLTEKRTSFNPATELVPYMILAFFALILGGVTSFYGPVVVAGIYPIVNAIVSYSAGKAQLGTWVDVIMRLLILLVMLILPYGIFGKKIQKKV